MRYANILSTGRYVPEKLLTNADVENILGEKVDEWLQQNVGIKQRHVMADDQATSDLAVAAAKEAMARAKVDPKDLDLVLVASDTPDYLSPGTSSVVQAKLGAVNAGTYDINAACAGWVTALDVASKTIASDDSYQRILVVGAYGMTRYVNWKDKKTCTLFADGAGAVVLGASDKPGFLGAKLLANGEYHDALGIYTGGTHRPATPETLALTNGKPAVQFVRKFPSTFNTERWPMLLDTLLKRADQTLDDVKLFVFTQLNLRTIEATMKALNQPMEKAHYTMDKWGYTGSACIPMTLDDAVMQGKVKKGDLVAFCASGGGLAMASALYRWTA
jgi:3-oxoacyl-[acyl-carrier-protein] synthase III